MIPTVEAKSDEIKKLSAEWPMLEALMAGTRAMRVAGPRLLPKYPNEENDSYGARLQTATLFPAFKRTVMVMSGKPMAKPVTLAADMPAQLVEWCDDIDNEGTNLHSFAAEMMIEALAYGLCGILVEAPKPIEGAGAVVTKADEKAAGVRPYWVRVKHDHILGWKLATINGKTTLTQLRLAEKGSVDDGPWAAKETERVRVLERGSWTLWEKQTTPAGKAVYVEIESGLSGLADIPFTPLYGSRLSYLMGETPLLDLAHMNVKHWQSQSDQDTILHVCRVPILFAAGFDDKDTITIGASAAIKSSNPQAVVKWVEHTGAAVDSGQASLDALENQMIQAGAELLVKKPGARSATESSNDAEANKSDLQRVTEIFENSLDQALQFTADYANLGAAGHVSLFKDFGASLLSDASATTILELEKAGVISEETSIKEFQRRGTLSGDLDAAEEAARVKAQGVQVGFVKDPTTGAVVPATASISIVPPPPDPEPDPTDPGEATEPGEVAPTPKKAKPKAKAAA